MQGAFTLWNLQNDPSAVITADLLDLSAGRFGAPVLGSGIFVSGAGEIGGRVEVQHLRTGPIYSDGRIESGTAGIISGGVFVVFGARADRWCSGMVIRDQQFMSSAQAGSPSYGAIPVRFIQWTRLARTDHRPASSF